MNQCSRVWVSGNYLLLSFKKKKFTNSLFTSLLIFVMHFLGMLVVFLSSPLGLHDVLVVMVLNISFWWTHYIWSRLTGVERYINDILHICIYCHEKIYIYLWELVYLKHPYSCFAGLFILVFTSLFRLLISILINFNNFYTKLRCFRDDIVKIK